MVASCSTVSVPEGETFVTFRFRSALSSVVPFKTSNCTTASLLTRTLTSELPLRLIDAATAVPLTMNP